MLVYEHSLGDPLHQKKLLKRLHPIHKPSHEHLRNAVHFFLQSRDHDNHGETQMMKMLLNLCLCIL